MSKLYLDHFHLQAPPFDLTPNPDFFYAGGQRGELLRALAYAVQDASGIIVVVGEVGSGKTMLCRMLAQALQQQECDLIYLDNPAFAPSEILHSIAADWGLRPEPGLALHVQIQRQLLQRHAQGRTVVLLIDEAQAMPPASLEEVRLLSNLESATSKLLRIVLFGQPELDEKLRRPELRQLRDRVVHRFDIQPLSAAEATRYLLHRLHCAGSRGEPIIEVAALRAIVQAGGGRLRALNQIAERALLAAYADGSRLVQAQHVRKAVRDVPRLETQAASRRVLWQSAAVAAAAAGATALGVGWWLWGARAPSGSTVAVTAAAAGRVEQAARQEADGSPAATAPPAPPQTAPSSGTAHDAAAAPLRSTAPIPEPVMARRQALLDRLADPQREGYLLQVATIATDPLPMLKQLGRISPQQPAWALERYYPPGSPTPVWAIFVGDYPSRQDAQAALALMPPALKKYGPQVRSLSALRAEPKPDRLPG